MQSAEELAVAITGIDPDAYIPGCAMYMKARESLATYTAMIAARDAEWQARVDKLEAVLKECGRKLDESLAAEDWGEVKSVWCDIDAALRRA